MHEFNNWYNNELDPNATHGEVALATYKNFCPQWHKPADKLPERNYINTQYLVTKVTSDAFILQWDSDRNHWYGKDGQIYKANEISYWTLIYPPEC